MTFENVVTQYQKNSREKLQKAIKGKPQKVIIYFSGTAYDDIMHNLLYCHVNLEGNIVDKDIVALESYTRTSDGLMDDDFVIKFIQNKGLVQKRMDRHYLLIQDEKIIRNTF